ncbi:LysR family transcriptional regulator [Variovorax robiniae]|uniref:LysR family transcriptional regulator n=1 Tax=Variovorax robiniae TaxID=1836199 RepID=A0ABU8XG88_9BURK
MAEKAPVAPRIPLLPALTLRQVQYFVVLAHARSFTLAAQSLSISQPALTAAIRQIEFLLGGRLFDRSSHLLALTEAGTNVLPLAERLLNTALGTFDDVASLLAEGVQTVRIGLIPSAADWLMPRLKTLRAQQPGLVFRLSDMSNTALIEAVQSRRVDVGIGVKDAQALRHDLVFEDLFEDDIVVVVHAKDPLARHKKVAWAQLAGQALAVFAHGNVSETLAQAGTALGLQLRPSFQMDYVEPIHALVRNQMALAIMPRLYTLNLHDPVLVTLGLTQPHVTRTISMLSAAMEDRSPQVAACRAWISRQV